MFEFKRGFRVCEARQRQKEGAPATPPRTSWLLAVPGAYR
jgi:hypothetical protein